MTEEKWPDWISGIENSEYLEKIKFEYIVSAELKRDDPYYERVASLWNISLDLDIDGQKSHAFIDYTNHLVEKFEKYLSTSKDFVITEDGKGLIIPFCAIDGLGENVAMKIIEERKKMPFISQEDLHNRGKCPTSAMEKLKDLGVFQNLSESNQLSLF